MTTEDPTPTPEREAAADANRSRTVMAVLAALGVALVVVVVLFATGVVGGSDDDDEEAAADATPTAPATARTGNTPAAGATTPAANPTASGSGISGRLQDLNSYRYTLKMEGTGGPLTELSSGLGSLPGGAPASGTVSLQATGAYVKPDKAQFTMNLGGGTVIGMTTIGTQQWITFGGITQGPTPISQPSPEDLSLAASFWDEGFLPSAGNFSCSGGRESINSVSTRKCSIDRNTFEQLRRSGGIFSAQESGIRDVSNFTMDLWVSDTGHPVRLRTDMAGKDTNNQDFRLNVELDLTEINGNITINPPR